MMLDLPLKVYSWHQEKKKKIAKKILKRWNFRRNKMKHKVSMANALRLHGKHGFP